MNIIITGASRGIGYELVKLFASDTNSTVIAIARDEQKLKKLKKECEDLYVLPKVITIAHDLKTESSAGLMKLILKSITSIDILINNAGSIVNKSFMELELKDLMNVYTVNVLSVFGLCKEVIPHINKKERAHIVNISSMGGVQGSAKFAGLSAYSSSKAALAVLTECMAEEFKDKNISFNCLALGAVQTEMLQEAFPGYKAPVSARQMAEYIYQFSTTAHHFMNGKIIPVSLTTP